MEKKPILLVLSKGNGTQRAALFSSGNNIFFQVTSVIWVSHFHSFPEYIKAFFAFGKVFKLNFAYQVYKSSRMARFIDERCKVEFEH